MKHGSLFSGIGGFDLAAEWMGWENVFHCEWNDFGQKVLKHYWPKAISYHDITKTDFTVHRGNIDILTGGFPCQPYSAAGKRKGKEDERHLWPEMLRAIREIRPRFVVGENVLGLVNWSGGLVFHEVQTDLEAAGYEVFPYVLPACAKDAPHRRDRVWFVAHCNGLRLEEYELQQPKLCEQYGKERDATDPTRIRMGGAQELENNQRQSGEWRGCDADNVSEVSGKNGFAADTRNTRLQGREINGSPGSIGSQRNELLAGLLPSDWEKFPTQSPLCGGDDGISRKLDGITFSKWRNESIKAYGNAIVPQVAHQIFKAIQQYEQNLLQP